MELKKEEERKEENIPKRDAQVFDGLVIGNCSDDFFVVAVEREGVECGRVCYPSNISSKKKKKRRIRKRKEDKRRDTQQSVRLQHLAPRTGPPTTSSPTW